MPDRTLGEDIDSLWSLREQIRALEESAKSLKQQFERDETALLQRLAGEDALSAAGRRASVTVSESIVPNVEDWEVFYRYIHRNNAYHLLERRPSAAAFREALDHRRGRNIPGVVPYTKRKLSLRTA